MLTANTDVDHAHSWRWPSNDALEYDPKAFEKRLAKQPESVERVSCLARIDRTLARLDD
jgi:hypothetical protein